MRSHLIFAFLFMAHVCAAATNDSHEKLPPIPQHIPFVLSAYGSQMVGADIEGVLEFHEGHARWKAPQQTKFSIARLIKLTARCEDWSTDLRIDLTFEAQGPKASERRFCFETRALDKDGKLLAHDWQVESDGRIGPAEIPMGSLTFLRSRYNSPFNKIPREALINVARLDIRLTEFPTGTPSHFPDGPHNLDLAITRPNRCGDFDVTFSNPRGWKLDPPKHQIAFQVFVYDAGKKFIRADRRFLMYRADGNYRQSVRVEPKYFANSRVSITVYTRQPDNDKFIRDFFYGGGSGYSGCWTGDGGKLVELPIQGVPLFDDLPEMALQDSRNVSR